MSLNHQVGTILVTRRPPVFDKLYRCGVATDITCVVRGGTWQEDDATKSSPEMNEVEETFSIQAYDQGETVKADLFPGEGFFPQVNDILEESAASAAIAIADGIPIFEAGGKRRYVIVAPVTRKQFGKRALVFSVSLMRRTALDLTSMECESS